MSAAHTYEFNIKMTCGGCSGAVDRALKKAQSEGLGIDSYEVSLEKQQAKVTGTFAEQDLVEKIKKTGKTLIDYREIKE